MLLTSTYKQYKSYKTEHIRNVWLVVQQNKLYYLNESDLTKVISGSAVYFCVLWVLRLLSSVEGSQGAVVFSCIFTLTYWVSVAV